MNEERVRGAQEAIVGGRGLSLRILCKAPLQLRFHDLALRKHGLNTFESRVFSVCGFCNYAFGIETM
jgi:hypothetical protein